MGTRTGAGTETGPRTAARYRHKSWAQETCSFLEREPSHILENTGSVSALLCSKICQPDLHILWEGRVVCPIHCTLSGGPCSCDRLGCFACRAVLHPFLKFFLLNSLPHIALLKQEDGCTCTCRHKWKALGPATQCMGFDFYEAADNMQGLQTPLALPIQTTGVLNAIAFWFELHLDEETSLSTSPYADKVRGCGNCFLMLSNDACRHCCAGVLHGRSKFPIELCKGDMCRLLCAALTGKC